MALRATQTGRLEKGSEMSVTYVSSAAHIMTIAGFSTYAVNVTMSDGTLERVWFNGPSDGDYPGPVFMVTRGMPEGIRVEDPQRFGDRFGPEWCRAFFGF